MKLKRNYQVTDAILRHKTFETRNKHIFGFWDGARGARGNIYTVYSYGLHFPLLVYDANIDKWFINTDKYSPTTARHQKLFPQGINATPVDTGLANLIAIHGFTGAMIKREQQAVGMIMEDV